ncbi:hypothetical protein BJ912DRAFT_921528 [Pholiota molesta]|nr:hypothetical protein BJ912DRAFT_921528 [Pholiota molesta]
MLKVINCLNGTEDIMMRCDRANKGCNGFVYARNGWDSYAGLPPEWYHDDREEQEGELERGPGLVDIEVSQVPQTAVQPTVQRPRPRMRAKRKRGSDEAEAKVGAPIILETHGNIGVPAYGPTYAYSTAKPPQKMLSLRKKSYAFEALDQESEVEDEQKSKLTEILVFLSLRKKSYAFEALDQESEVEDAKPPQKMLSLRKKSYAFEALDQESEVEDGHFEPT